MHGCCDISTHRWFKANIVFIIPQIPFKNIAIAPCMWTKRHLIHRWKPMLKSSIYERTVTVSLSVVMA